MKTVKRNTIAFPSFFEGLFTENRLDVPNYEKFSIPPVNISEKNANFVLEIAIPGIDKKDIAIEIEENILKVSSKTNDQQSTENTNDEVTYSRKEFNYKSFTRTFTLPETINEEDIDAVYNAGVLVITLPKKEEKKASKKMVEIS